MKVKIKVLQRLSGEGVKHDLRDFAIFAKFEKLKLSLLNPKLNFSPNTIFQ